MKICFPMPISTIPFCVTVFAFMLAAPKAAAQTQNHDEHESPKAPKELKHSAQDSPTLRVNPHGTETQSLAETLTQQPAEPTGLYPRKDWPSPVEDRMKHFLFLADLLEYSSSGSDSSVRWDIESYYGGDFNRLWLKSEGERSTTETDYNADFQALYGRFFKKYYDFQVGLRGEATNFEGDTESRAHAVIGLEGLVPYRFDIEPSLFISHEGDISARFTLTRELLLTQKVVVQGRFETEAAIQEVEKFGVGSGLNNIEVGLRLRYEIRREFAPYVGISYERSFFGTEDLARRAGEDPHQLRFVAGIRIWF